MKYNILSYNVRELVDFDRARRAEVLLREQYLDPTTLLLTPKLDSRML